MLCRFVVLIWLSDWYDVEFGENRRIDIAVALSNPKAGITLPCYPGYVPLKGVLVNVKGAFY